MELYKNMIFEWVSIQSPDGVERLLWLHPNSEYVWTIRVFGRKVRPVKLRQDYLESAIATGEARVLSSDPYASLCRPDGDISKKRRRGRDKAWAIIGPLVEEEDPRIFDFWSRGASINAYVKRSGHPKSTVYDLLIKERCIDR